MMSNDKSSSLQTIPKKNQNVYESRNVHYHDSEILKIKARQFAQLLYIYIYAQQFICKYLVCKIKRY